ncbi:MAG: GNAT family N-acetyltransferase [Bacteroidales bacterium]|nr:GNAT family N-acetyltransferase [Bacteroidales bacterium]
MNNIRLEQPRDYRVVENLTREAFWNVYQPGCTEHYVLNQYRNNPDFIPELDFVMEDDGRIIGHVMFSKAQITLKDGSAFPSWTFGPISIHPDYKRKGYGLKLLNYALEKARGMGVGCLCMEGNIDFYRHAGFDYASNLNIHYHDMPWDKKVPFFLAQELIPGYLKGIEGTYCPPKGYFVADENIDAFEAYEKTFPRKVKAFNEGQLPPYAEKTALVMQSDRLLLRPWIVSDAATLFLYASDPVVGPRAGWEPHQCVEESREIIRTVFHNDTTWAIVLKETDEVIGCIGYQPCTLALPARENEPLVGYWVAKPFWNQGVCTEALKMMLDRIRTTTDIRSLISGHFIDNPASGRVMIKCGFLPTGEEVIDRTLSGNEDKLMRVLRLEL